MTITATPGKLGALAGKPRLIWEDVMDYLLVNPGCTGKEVAKHFGMSYQWVLILTNSDAFQKRLEERRKELLDPTVKTLLEDRMKGLVQQSVETLMRKLEASDDPQVALKALDISTRALGYGAKPTVEVNNRQTTFVVQAPPKAKDPGSWLEAHAPARLGLTIDNPVELARDNPPNE